MGERSTLLNFHSCGWDVHPSWLRATSRTQGDGPSLGELREALIQGNTWPSHQEESEQFGDHRKSQGEFGRHVPNSEPLHRPYRHL